MSAKHHITIRTDAVDLLSLQERLRWWADKPELAKTPRGQERIANLTNRINNYNKPLGTVPYYTP